uniref:S24 family peptidase n=1 Tax=Aliarcobacter sp. TaxID=2321116 RepID=UPI0040488EA3
MEKRLKTALKKLGLTYDDLSNKLETNLSNIKAMAVGRKIITPKIASDIQRTTGINASWLLLGDGDMFDKPSGALSKAFGDDSGSRYSISYYPDIKASAGLGYCNSNDSDVEIISLPKAIIDKRIKTSKIDAIRVHGDSMTPTIRENDVIFVATNMQEVHDNKIYVIRYGDEIRVKRIFKRIGEKILLRSDNQAFPDEEISVHDEEVSILGQVIYNMADLS